MIWFFAVLTLIFGGCFLILKIKASPSLWLGFTFLAMIANLLMTSVILMLRYDIVIPLLIFAIIILVIFFIPILVAGTFLFNGIKLLFREGVKISNLLSLVFGIGLLFYVFIWPLIVDIRTSHLLNTVYQFVTFVVVYISFMMILYAVTNWLSTVHIKQPHIDYFIVLGAGLFGDKVTPLLAKRINRGLELHKKQPHSTIIFSGGKGYDELISEGEAMEKYAIDSGADPERILKETHSKNTYENIVYSTQVISAHWYDNQPPKIAIVTSNYHVLRSLMFAKREGLNAIGYGAPSKFYFSLNAFMREFAAFLQMTFNFHAGIIVLVGVFLVAVFLLTGNI